MKSFMLAVLMLSVSCPFFAQTGPQLIASVSSDSVFMGHYFELTFTVENVQNVEFIPPAVQGFDVLSGPNSSSMISMVNGAVSQTTSYKYILQPRGEGTYFLPSASIELDGNLISSEELSITVIPNPDNIPQPQPQMNGFNDMGMDIFKNFQMPDMEQFFMPFGSDSLNTFPNFQDMFKQFRDMPFPDPTLPPKDSIKSKPKRKIYRI